MPQEDSEKVEEEQEEMKQLPWIIDLLVVAVV